MLFRSGSTEVGSSQMPIFRLTYLDGADGLQAVFGFQDLVFLSQHIRQNGAVHLRVVGNEDPLLACMFSVNGSHIPSLEPVRLLPLAA